MTARLQGHGFTTAAAVALSMGAGAGLAAASTSGTMSLALLIGLLVLATAATIVYEVRVAKDGLSILTLNAGFYLVAFAIGAVYYRLSPGRQLEHAFGTADLTFAVGLVTLAWVGLVVGYFANPLRVLTAALPRLPKAPVASVGWTVVPLLVLGWAARLEIVASGRYFHAPAGGAIAATGSSWIVATCALLPTLATAYVGACASPLGGRPVLHRTFWTLLAVEVAWAVPSGARGNLLGIVAMLAALRYYGHGRRVPRSAVALGALVVVFVVFPFGLHYRGDNRHYQTETRASLARALHETFHANPVATFHDGVTATFSRFSDITSLAVIPAHGRAPLGAGPTDSLLWSVQTFLPRAVFPGKADPGLAGATFGRRYGLTAPNDQVTSVAVTAPGELYLDFGLAGIVLGMPIVGAFYRVLNEYFAGRRTEVSTLAVYAVSCWLFVNSQEAILALGLASVFKTMLFLAVVLGMVNLLRRRVARVDVPVPARGAS